MNIHNLNSDILKKLREDKTAVIVLETDNEHGMAEQRRAFFGLITNHLENPVIIKRKYKNLNFIYNNIKTQSYKVN